jgi:quinol monooxygenase YgiN
MTVLVTLKFPVKPIELDNFLTVLKEALIDTRAYEGCESVLTCVERGTSAVFLVETWESAEHQQSYMTWRVETGLIAAIEPFLDGEIDVHTFDPMHEI